MTSLLFPPHPARSSLVDDSLYQNIWISEAVEWGQPDRKPSSSLLLVYVDTWRVTEDSRINEVIDRNSLAHFSRKIFAFRAADCNVMY